MTPRGPAAAAAAGPPLEGLLRIDNYALWRNNRTRRRTVGIFIKGCSHNVEKSYLDIIKIIITYGCDDDSNGSDDDEMLPIPI